MVSINVFSRIGNTSNFTVKLRNESIFSEIGIFMAKILIFISGVFVGIGAMFFFITDIDLLSESRGYTVSLKENVNFLVEEETKFILPKGTLLKFNSQYHDIGEFSLSIIITDLSVIEKKDGDSKYFSEE